jgi:predicted metal-dependent phosphoesterase TrpH
MAKKKGRATRKWYSMDLHIHTPASSDHQQADVSYLDILQRAETRSLDIISFTDHNTVAGYRSMQEEIEQLDLLKRIKRILPEEEIRLKEYQRLQKKILILPGFEFTATFGFHILAIFPPRKPIREIEHILLQLNIPADQLDEGSVTVGASSDVLNAYRQINEAGGLVIAAHANSSNGVAMRGFSFGGQTKISYTQDQHLHALEVTDLEHRGRHTTASFFRGTKPEYPRRMHCIQGSDSHRLEMDKSRKKNLGVGDRVTEVLLSEVSFKALLDLFIRNDFARTRPRRRKKEEQDFDFIRAAREEGSNIIQDFHASMTVRGGKLYAIIADVCALANTNGGTLYVGIDNDPTNPITGVNSPGQSIKQLEKEISNRISPPLTCTVDAHITNGKNVIRILVPRGEDPPYAVDDNKIYVREEGETGLAVRDEIVGLVNRGKVAIAVAEQQPVSLVPKPEPVQKVAKKVAAHPPRTGVEIVNVVERNGVKYYTVRDLRNGNTVKNVTEKSARRLWHYAITHFVGLPTGIQKAKIDWQKNLGILRKYKLGKRQVYDLVQREGKKFRTYYGVTEDGVHGVWRQLVGLEGEE